MDNKTLLKNIDLFCEAKGITKADMLRELNLPSSTISNWKNRNNLPSVETVYLLSNYFHVPMEYLLLDEKKELDDDLCKAIAELSALTPDQRKPIMAIISDQVKYWLNFFAK